MTQCGGIKFGIVRYHKYSGALEVVVKDRIFYYESGSLIPFNNIFDPFKWYYIQSPCDDPHCKKEDEHTHNYKANLLHVSGKWSLLPICM